VRGLFDVEDNVAPLLDLNIREVEAESRVALTVIHVMRR